MVHENVVGLKREVKRWCRALGITQNEYARRCGVHHSILSRVLNKKVTSAPAIEKMRTYNERLLRQIDRAS